MALTACGDAHGALDKKLCRGLSELHLLLGPRWSPTGTFFSIMIHSLAVLVPLLASLTVVSAQTGTLWSVPLFSAWSSTERMVQLCIQSMPTEHALLQRIWILWNRKCE